MSEVDGRLRDVAGFSAARLARIDNVFNVEVARGLIPGAVLLIERKGETVLKRAWGYRNRAAGTAMTTDTIFRIHSMTKPLVSLATLMLAAEGRLHLSQPVADFIPAFARVRVLVEGCEVEPVRPPSVHDLLRHTAGLIYERNGGPVAPLYAAANVGALDVDNEGFADRLAAVPLAHQPGTVWEYGHATEVLGRVVEVVAGRSLGAVLRQRLIVPLGMVDTDFHVPDPDDHARIAEPFAGELLPGERPFVDPRREPLLEAGGSGLVSTLDDYAAFCRMLLAGGATADDVLLSQATMRWATADHIGPETGIALAPGSMVEPGFGFGLGFAVRRALGAAPFPGSLGEIMWTGMADTMFWVDPVEDLFVVFMAQAPRQRFRHRAVLKALVYDALLGRRGLKAEKRARRTEDQRQ